MRRQVRWLRVRKDSMREGTTCDDREFRLEERFRGSFYDRFDIGTDAIEMDPS